MKGLKVRPEVGKGARRGGSLCGEEGEKGRRCWEGNERRVGRAGFVSLSGR
jgi:hypothetical protein